MVRIATVLMLIGIALFSLTHFKPFMGMKISEIAIFLCFIIMAANCLIYRSFPKLPVLFAWSACIFTVACLISWIVAMNSVDTTLVEYRGIIYQQPFINIFTIIRFVFSIIIVWLVISVVRDMHSLHLFAVIHVLGGLFAASIGIILYIMFVANIQFVFTLFREFGSQTGVWGFRLAGTAYEPAAFGNYFVSVVPITAAFVLTAVGRWKTMFWFIVLIIQGIALVLTFSTGAWACSILAIIALLLLFWRYIPVSKFALIPITGLVLLSIIFIIINAANINIAGIASVVSKVGTDSVSARADTSARLIAMFVDHPIVGVGIGNFAHTFGIYTLTSDEQYFRYIYPADWRANNDYLTILAETGIIGLMAFLLLLISISIEIIFTLRKVYSDSHSLILAGMACAVFALLVQSWVAFTIFNPYIWILVGLMIAGTRMVSNAYEQSK